ncbi:hypothetical protein HZB02_05205 [Candidatus Woesearchaeota archaeon]|nr:hypothetical protein [Candidatus Woesearchaeota archaeon]
MALDDHVSLAKELRGEVFAHMRKTRGKKYQGFLLAFSAFRHIIAKTPHHADLMEFYYCLNRYLDDIADRDLRVPEIKDPAAYLTQKISFAQDPHDPEDRVDQLILLTYDLARKIGHDIRAETLDIFSSLQFDALRWGKQKIFQADELDQHFYRLDIRGTIKGAMKIGNENPQRFGLIMPLGRAVRIYYNLRDYAEDISQCGYINISQEDVTRLRMSMESLTNPQDPTMKQWFAEQAEKGLAYLEEHRTMLRGERFNPSTHATFKIVYELPARRYLERVLKTQGR